MSLFSLAEGGILFNTTLPLLTVSQLVLYLRYIPWKTSGYFEALPSMFNSQSPFLSHNKVQKERVYSRFNVSEAETFH